MKPLNADDKGCNPISSNCVIWQGPNIPCINLCKGDTISDVMYKNATELCNILDILKISTYDLSCLNLTSCQPSDFTELIQLLINRICNLEECTNCAPSCDTTNANPEPVPANLPGCPDCEMPIASCLYFTNGLGDTVQYLQLKDYVTLLGNKICTLLAALTTTNENTLANGARIGTVETQVNEILATPPAYPQIVPTCVISPAVLTDLDVVVQALESQFCLLRDVTGNPVDIQLNVIKQCAGLNSDNRLAGSGVMATIPGWTNTVTNLAESFGNMWLTICDMRAAIKNIQANCCPSGCDGVSFGLTANILGYNISIFMTGTIPPGYVQCYGYTPFTFTDANGGTLTVNLDLVAVVNSPGGYNYILPSPGPVNPLLDVTVIVDPCIKDPVTGTTCTSCVSYTIGSSLTCPTFSIFSITTNAVTYSLLTTTGNYTYTVELYDSTGVILISSSTYISTTGVLYNGSFTLLDPGTTYKIKVKVVQTGCMSCTPTDCGFTEFTTQPCPAPTDVTASIIVIL